MLHNYYLYENDGRLAMLPWDYICRKKPRTPPYANTLPVSDVFYNDSKIDTHKGITGRDTTIIKQLNRY